MFKSDPAIGEADSHNHKNLLYFPFGSIASFLKDFPGLQNLAFLLCMMTNYNKTITWKSVSIIRI